VRLYDYPGAFHVHSTHSDGTATVPRIAAAAQRAGLSWIVVSDHDSLGALENREAGWYDSTAVLVGYEITPEENHYLVLGLAALLPPSMPTAEIVASVKEKGGWGFVLHPDEKRGSYFKAPLPWRERSLRGFNGIEIWNYMSQWTEGLTERNRFARFLFPTLAVRGPTTDVLGWWDQILSEGERVSAVAGLDTHATHFQFGRLRLEVFPYYRQFGTLVNHIVLRRPLSQEWDAAVQQIGGALAGGHSYFAYHAWGKARGFTFVADREGESWTIGEEIPPGREVRLSVSSPRWGQIRIIRDGRLLLRGLGRSLTAAIQEPGAYRVEVRRFGRPWLFSNPIYLARRRERLQEERVWIPRVRRPWD